MRARTRVLLVMSCALYAGCGDDSSKKPSSQSSTPAAAPAAGGLIVYGAEKEGSPTQLVTIRPDGTGATQITHVTGDGAVNPDWSPDGSQIVYEGDSAKGAGIILVDADGSN